MSSRITLDRWPACGFWSSVCYWLRRLPLESCVASSTYSPRPSGLIRSRAIRSRKIVTRAANGVGRFSSPGLKAAYAISTARSDISAGNLRILANMANDLLDVAAHRRLEKIDAELYFEVFNPQRLTQQ